MKTKSQCIRTYIDHISALKAGTTLAKAKKQLQGSLTGYAAVLNGNHVIGLTSLDHIEKIEGSSAAPPKNVQEVLIAEPTICTTSLPIETNLTYALQQSADNTHDIIIIDKSMEFVGLIQFRTLLRIQRDYYSEQLSQKNFEIYIQREKLSNLKSTKDEYKRKIEKILQSREEFIVRFGHEAKTPMTSIQGVLELIPSSKLNSDHAQMLQSANGCARTLLRLIDNTVEYANIEANKLEITETTYSPLQSLQQCIQNTTAEASEKGLVLEFLNQNIPAYIIGDNKHLSRSIENILAKAIDHTNSGGIKVSARKETYKKSHWLIIEITASSTNWSSLNSLNTNQNPDQYDIGLIVSTSVIHRLGGKFTYEENSKTGSCYKIELPVKVLSPQASATSDQIKELAAQAAAQSPKTQLKVLVVDDNTVNLKVAIRFLKLLDCQVTTAMSGKEALSQLQDHSFDCIFMDCSMPEMTGYEATELIREGQAGEANKEIFISAMTAQTSNRAKEKCFESGMNYYVPKPVNKRSFELALNSYSKHSQQTVELYSEDSETKKQA